MASDYGVCVSVNCGGLGCPAYGSLSLSRAAGFVSFTAAEGVLRLLEPVACWVLVISLIHQERLIGHEQYWLTRPYSWRDLVASKALFVLTSSPFRCFCVSAPRLRLDGLAPFEWLGRCCVGRFLPDLLCAAGRCVSRRHGKPGGSSAAVPTSRFWRSAHRQYGRRIRVGRIGLDLTCGFALVLTVGLSAALFVQYTRRRTALARAMVALTLCATIASAFAPVWAARSRFRERFRQSA